MTITANTIRHIVEEKEIDRLTEMLYDLIQVWNKKLSPLGLSDPDYNLNAQFYLFLTADTNLNLTSQQCFSIIKKYAKEFSKFFIDSKFTVDVLVKSKTSTIPVEIEIEYADSDYTTPLRWCRLCFGLEWVKRSNTAGILLSITQYSESFIRDIQFSSARRGLTDTKISELSLEYQKTMNDLIERTVKAIRLTSIN